MRKLFLSFALVCTVAFALSCSKNNADKGPSDKKDEKVVAKECLVSGHVTCNGAGLPGVVVSDGVEVTATDNDGFYSINTKKRFGYVFISIPSGYEAASNGVCPSFYAQVDDYSSEQTSDFALTKKDGQDKHTMFFLGDLHLANRSNTNDLNQFRIFTNELKSYVNAHKPAAMYATTLGDMTWDLYWYDHKYSFSNYLNTVNVNLAGTGLQIFHCIGNHDHEMGQEGAYPVGELACSKAFRKALGPTFYSYNIGKIHYMVVDDIYCTNDGSGDRTYDSHVDDDNLAWIRKDLSYVSKDTPVVVSMHSPAFKESGSDKLDNTSELVACFKGYRTYFISGHTHRMYNVVKSDSMMDLNSGSICATWWWTGYYNIDLNIATDGTPGGYRIWDVDGTDIKWHYKSTGWDISHQFRTYDRNMIRITAEKYLSTSDSKATSELKKLFDKEAGEYNKASTDNQVLILVYDYDPSWKVSVTENGKSLDVKGPVSKDDPLHFLAYEAYRSNLGNEPNFTTDKSYNFFTVNATSPSSTLEIKVTNRFGEVYSESMKRPKEFSLDTYRSIGN